MKNLFDDDFKLSEIKSLINKNNSKSKCKVLISILAVIGVISTIAAITYAIMKFCRSSDEFDFDDFAYDDESDEDGSYFANEEDFEK